MRLTTKGRFAVTAMIDVAMHGGRGPVALAAVSSRQKISLSYLEQLFGKRRSIVVVQHQCIEADLFTRFHARSLPNGYSGMLPCFFGGFRSALFSSISSARTIFDRVCRGSITSSKKPRPAGMYGFANFERRDGRLWNQIMAIVAKLIS